MPGRKTTSKTGGKSLATTAPRPREIAHRMAGGDAVVRVDAIYHGPGAFGWMRGTW